MNPGAKTSTLLVRRLVVVAFVLVAVGSCGAWLLLTRSPAPKAGAESDLDGRLTSALAPPKSSGRVLTNAAKAKHDRAQTAAARVAPAPDAKASAAVAPLPDPTPYARQLVGALCRVDQAGVAWTAEQVAEWKQNLQQLVGQGPAAVAALREFLQKNVDLDFGLGTGLGYASARAAMFDALVQIGGAEGIAGTLQTLRETADPREIAILAQNLEKLAPGEHRQEAIEAARDALAMAASGKLEGTDVAPLFEVLNKFGDTSVVTDLLEAAKQWNYYSAIALARLPDGAGIPTLTEMAQGTSGGRLNALEMLAQMSAHYPEARSALVEQARANNISPNMWPYLTPLLAGDLYHFQDSPFDSPAPAQGRPGWRAAHVVFGNQSFYTAPSAEILTPEEINQRLAMVEELESVASDPAARKALEQSRELLEGRRPQTVAVSP